MQFSKNLFSLTSSEYRPCYVTPSIIKGGAKYPKEEKALFHKWVLEQQPIPAGLSIGSHPGGQLSQVLGLVELEDGTVQLVAPIKIRFIDTQSYMEQLCYDERPGVDNEKL